MLLLLTLGLFGMAFAGLAVGVIFTKDKELGGSCGGPDVNPECCQTCPEQDACEDVRELALSVPPPSGRPTPAALRQIRER